MKSKTYLIVTIIILLVVKNNRRFQVNSADRRNQNSSSIKLYDLQWKNFEFLEQFISQVKVSRIDVNSKSVSI